MTKSFLGSVVVAAMLSAWPPMAAQPTPPNDHLGQVFENAGRLTLEVTLDRQEFLSGESVWVTWAVSNPTTEPLEVFDPQWQAGFNLLKWGHRIAPEMDQWEPCTPDSLGEQGVAWGSPTITLGPGQRVEIRSVFFGGECPGCEAVIGASKPLPVAGRYIIDYCYVERGDNCAHAEFNIVEPLVRKSAFVRLNAVYRQPPEEGSDEVVESPLYANALLLDSGGKRYVVVARASDLSHEVRIGPAGKLDTAIRGLVEPYDRIAEVNPAVNAIRLTADDQDNLTVSWTDENGQPKAWYLSADRSIIEEVQPPAPPVPTLSSITVTQRMPLADGGGAIVSLTLTGGHLSGVTALSIVPSTGIQVDSFRAVDDSTVRAMLSVDGGVQESRAVSVTTPAGTSNAVSFFADGGPPVPPPPPPPPPDEM